MDELVARKIDPKWVTRLFTERQPCDTPDYECVDLLHMAFGDNPVEVTYLVPFRPQETASLAAGRLKSILRAHE